MVKRKNKIRRTIEDYIIDTIVTVVVGFVALVCLYPMVHVFFASLSDSVEISFHSGALLWPKGFSLASYQAILKRKDIWIGYENTLFYVCVGTAINMVLTIVGAYALSRKDFALKRPLSLFIVFSMYFSAGLIPNFLLMKELHLLNTRWALILPGAIGTYNLMVMRTAFRQIPESLEEAALLDGANDFQVLVRVLLPLAKATIAVIFLFYVVGHWNAWFGAMAYLPMARELYPLQMTLREIIISNSESISSGTTMDYLGESVRYSAIIVATLPVLCLYPFVQRYFVKGVMLGSVKG